MRRSSMKEFQLFPEIKSLGFFEGFRRGLGISC